ncbi:MAG: ABC transporter permease [Gemmatimonadota bacterium]|nr:ABC transporter permease [Gemmatimonadota bacterium]MDH3424897.1 ABC transporter permease [Gemmatimonadota bacterium]
MHRTLAPVRAVGRGALRSVEAVGEAGYLGLDALRALRKFELWGPHLVGQMVRIGVESIPIALFIASFTGVVLALQASYTFTGAVPLYFVGTLVGKTMILELGPVLTGLALSGRVGANIAAQIGTMRVTEQIDALETLAYDPVAYLVVPRVLAGTLMFPVVVLLANAIGILAGWGTSLALLDMSSPEFVKGLRLFFEPWDVQFSLIKSASFGLTVTSVGCSFGFHTTGGAEGVGISTTRAVVISSMIILVLDAFWAATLLQ